MYAVVVSMFRRAILRIYQTSCLVNAFLLCGRLDARVSGRFHVIILQSLWSMPVRFAGEPADIITQEVWSVHPRVST